LKSGIGGSADDSPQVFRVPTLVGQLPGEDFSREAIRLPLPRLPDSNGLRKRALREKLADLDNSPERFLASDQRNYPTKVGTLNALSESGP